jgi:hypothetical protein
LYCSWSWLHALKELNLSSTSTVQSSGAADVDAADADSDAADAFDGFEWW